MHKLTWRNCWSASVPATCVTAPINIIANNLFLVSMKAVLGNEVVREAFGVFGRTALDIIKPSVPSHKCRHVRPSAYTLQSCGYGRNKVCASGSFSLLKRGGEGCDHVHVVCRIAFYLRMNFRRLRASPSARWECQSDFSPFSFNRHFN